MINVRMRYFAQMRETLGCGEESRQINEGTTVSTLFDAVAAEHVSLAGMKPATMLMVNQEYVTADHRLADGDEVAFIPPVSGGSEASPHRFVVTDAQLDARSVESAVADPAAGAVVTFTGTVRDHARGRSVTALDYEAYAPAAEKMLARIGDEIRDQWGIERVAIWHRIGLLTVGEASVIIAVASAHRGEAFAACQYAIARLKEIVPIWKKEHYADGATWVGSEAEYQRQQRAAAVSLTVNRS
jgi:molybdopterin converting factor subunit 1